MAPDEAPAAAAALERVPSVGSALLSAGDVPRTTGRSLAPAGSRGQVLAQAECYVALDGRKISVESELANRRFVQLVKRPGHPRFVLYVHPPVDAGPNDDPVVLDLDPDTPLWLLRPADATRVGAAPESAAAAAAAGVGAGDAATAAAVAEAAGKPLALYDFEMTYSRKQAELAVKRASSSAGGGAGASSGGAPNPFFAPGAAAGASASGGAGNGGGGPVARLLGCFRKPPPPGGGPDTPAADPAAAAAANATAAAAAAATGVQPGTPRTPRGLARIKEALAHAQVPSHKKVRLAFEDEVLAKTWHSLVAVTLGYVGQPVGTTTAHGGGGNGGSKSQSALGAYNQ